MDCHFRFGNLFCKLKSLLLGSSNNHESLILFISSKCKRKNIFHFLLIKLFFVKIIESHTSYSLAFAGSLASLVKHKFTFPNFLSNATKGTYFVQKHIPFQATKKPNFKIFSKILIGTILTEKFYLIILSLLEFFLGNHTLVTNSLYNLFTKFNAASMHLLKNNVHFINSTNLFGKNTVTFLILKSVNSRELSSHTIDTPPIINNALHFYFVHVVTYYYIYICILFHTVNLYLALTLTYIQIHSNLLTKFYALIGAILVKPFSISKYLILSNLSEDNLDEINPTNNESIPRQLRTRVLTLADFFKITRFTMPAINFHYTILLYGRIKNHLSRILNVTKTVISCEHRIRSRIVVILSNFYAVVLTIYYKNKSLSIFPKTIGIFVLNIISNYRLRILINLLIAHYSIKIPPEYRQNLKLSYLSTDHNSITSEILFSATLHKIHTRLFVCDSSGCSNANAKISSNICYASYLNKFLDYCLPIHVSHFKQYFLKLHHQTLCEKLIVLSTKRTKPFCKLFKSCNAIRIDEVIFIKKRTTELDQATTKIPQPVLKSKLHNKQKISIVVFEAQAVYLIKINYPVNVYNDPPGCSNDASSIYFLQGCLCASVNSTSLIRTNSFPSVMYVAVNMMTEIRNVVVNKKVGVEGTESVLIHEYQC